MPETADQKARRRARERVSQLDRHHRICAMLEERASLVLYYSRRGAA